MPRGLNRCPKSGLSRLQAPRCESLLDAGGRNLSSVIRDQVSALALVLRGPVPASQPARSSFVRCPLGQPRRGHPRRAMMAAMPRMHVLTGDGQWIPMADTPYDSEDYLQKLLATHPELMPGELFDASDPRRWLLLTREAGIHLATDPSASRWSMDHLFVDQEAVPTLVEVKRSSDTRSRREVVAQMLDYASNLWVWGPGQARSCLDSRCVKDGLNPDTELEAFLGPQVDAGLFWNQVDANITAGRLRLVFVADRIGPELRQIIEFLNSQFARAEVVAVEVRQWRGEGVDTLVSEVIGRTAAADALHKGSQAARHVTREEFLAALRARCTSQDADGVEALISWCETNDGWVTFGTGMAWPACYLNWRSENPIWALIPTVPNQGGPSAQPRQGYVYVPFDVLAVRTPFDDATLRDEFRERLEAIDGITFSTKTRPSFPMGVLANPARRQQVFDVLAWFVSQLQGSKGVPEAEVP